MDLKKKKKRDLTDKVWKYTFATFAYASIVLLLIITGYIIITGIAPFLPGNEYGQVSFISFITGMKWNPSNEFYGVLYMILGTFFAMLLAMLLAIPIAILTAIAVSELLPPKLASFISGAIELLAGIPSIIYGMFGLIVIVPIIANLPMNDQPQGNSLLAVAIVLAMMTLPTIITVTEAAINAVPDSFKEASLGLGASRIQTIFKVTLPAAKSGIVAAIILGIGRAIGETMAVVMVAGNNESGFVFPGQGDFLFQPIRPLTANIATDISYASGVHAQLLFSTGLVLFIFIFLLNVTVQWVSRGGSNK